MSARPMIELLAELGQAEKLFRTAPPSSIQRREASMTIAAIFEEIGKRTRAALGSALSTTLLETSEVDAAVAIMLGDRLLTELHRRGLEILPVGDLPPV